MTTLAPTPDWLDAKTPNTSNLLNVALDTLERVQAAGVVADSALAADIADTIGQLREALLTPPSRALKAAASAEGSR